MTVKDVDKGYNALVKRVFGVQRPVIKVGIFEREGALRKQERELRGGQTVRASQSDRAPTVIEVAERNEFGLGVPERSFVRAWFDQNEGRNRAAILKLLKAIVSGKRTKEEALELLGLSFVAGIQQRIADGIEPANAESTVQRKGSSTPLIDTGQLRSSITHKVEK